MKEKLKALEIDTPRQRGLKDWKIETTDGGAKLTFLTSAKTVRSALKRLINNSHDFKSVEGNITIKIKQLSEKK